MKKWITPLLFVVVIAVLTVLQIPACSSFVQREGGRYEFMQTDSLFWVALRNTILLCVVQDVILCTIVFVLVLLAFRKLSLSTPMRYLIVILTSAVAAGVGTFDNIPVLINLLLGLQFGFLFGLVFWIIETIRQAIGKKKTVEE